MFLKILQIGYLVFTGQLLLLFAIRSFPATGLLEDLAGIQMIVWLIFTPFILITSGYRHYKRINSRIDSLAFVISVCSFVYLFFIFYYAYNSGGIVEEFDYSQENIPSIPTSI